MNRSVMQRQMFAAGGAAGLRPIPQGNMGLPNLPQGVRNNMGYMAMGGSVPPMMPPAQGIMSAAPPGMRPQMPPRMMANGGNPMMGAPMPSPEMMANEGAKMMDPQTLEGVLSEAQASGYGDPEAAGDFETMMNSVSGEEKPLEERRNDLASIVGPEDADQTPESVLALVTPIVQIALVDQGIGPMAQEQMNTPVEGDMGQGIMTMAANGNMGVGNEPPVNFNLGGEVRRRGDEDPVPVFEQGGEVQYFASPNSRIAGLTNSDILALNKAGELFEADTSGVMSTPYVEKKEPIPNRLKELFEQKKGVYGDILGSSEDQKNMTQAQMLFDIANTALTFAAPMQGEKAGLSPAQRLAMAATQTKLPQTIAARSADLTAQKQKLDLAALQAAETTLTAEDKAASAKEIALAKDTSKAGSFVIAVNEAGKVVGRYDQNSSTDKALIKNLPDNVTLKKIGELKNKTSKLINVFEDGVYTQNLDLSDKGDKEKYDKLKVNKKNTFFTVGNQPTADKATKPKYMKIVPIENGIANTANGVSIDINSDEGKSAIAQMKLDNEKTDGKKYQLYDTSTEKQSITAQPYILNGNIVYSFDGRNVQVKEDGKIVNKNITDVGAVVITDDTAFTVLKAVKSSKKADKELEELNTLELGDQYQNTNDFKAVTNAMNHARNGTGPWSSFQALINNTVGGITGTAPFKDNADSRNFLKAIELLSRTALVSNSRYALGEMAAISELYPNPDNVFRSPKSEAAKFMQLKRFAIQFKRNNLEALKEGGLDAAGRASYNKHNRSLDRLLSLLSDVPVTTTGTGGGITIDQLNKAKSILKGTS